MKDLLENKSVKRCSRIAPPSPFLSPNGLILSPDRIKWFMEVGFNVKYPIILDARHSFVKMFLEHTHVKHYHQGVEYLRSIMQEHHKVLRLKERLVYQPLPFTNTSVDYFGPLYVTMRRTTEKRWGFLFTCLTTRAVHVKIITSMETSSCVMGVYGSSLCHLGEHLPWIGLTMALTLLERRKNSEKVLKSGTLSTLQLSSLTKEV